MRRLLTAIAWLCLICVAASEPVSKEGDALATLEQLLATKFPKSAAVLFYRHTVGMDDAWSAKVTISRADMDNLLKTGPFKTVVWKRGVHCTSIAKAWWRTDLLTAPLSAQIRLKPGLGANIVYGVGKSSQLTVLYFDIFET